MYGTFAALAVAALALWKGLVTHDFNIEYVAAYTSRNLPSGYIVSALWAGQKGSLLFWALVLSSVRLRSPSCSRPGAMRRCFRTWRG